MFFVNHPYLWSLSHRSLSRRSLSRRLLPFRKVILLLVVLISALGLQGCKEDLVPSDKDERNTQANFTTDFSAQTTTGEQVDLASLLMAHDSVVLYFTMWCPLCDTHMGYMSREIIPQYPDTAFFMVDYVSGSNSQSRRSQVENGYQMLTVLTDVEHSLLNQFHGTMATTVVIGQDKAILMNEDFKNGARLIDALNSLGAP